MRNRNYIINWNDIQSWFYVTKSDRGWAGSKNIFGYESYIMSIMGRRRIKF
jgi:hypothetical protein